MRRDLAGESAEMVSEGSQNPAPELRKRRSTRIVQAVPLQVTGVDALGRPFIERTSTLIINCHGCRYQSKHYVLKNMWVSLEVPHSETGQAPRNVRGRVAWIQRPRTVRQLFQVALELEIPGNAWGIAFPPEDWFAFPDQPSIGVIPEGDQAPEDIAHGEPAKLAMTEEMHVPLEEPEVKTPAESSLHETEGQFAAATAPDNLRVFPAPASSTDASLQLARQVARLVAEAKQQIHATAREAASQAVSAERRLTFEQWEQKFSAARAEIANQAAQAILKVQDEAEARVRSASEAAVSELRLDLPRLLRPQLEHLASNLTEQLATAGASQITQHTEQLDHAVQLLEAARERAEESSAALRHQAEKTFAQIAERSAATGKSLEDAAKRNEEAVGAQAQTLNAAAKETHDRVLSEMTAAQSSWRDQLTRELEAAQTKWQETLDKSATAMQERTGKTLSESADGLAARLHDEAAQINARIQEAVALATSDTEQHLKALRVSLQEGTQRLEAVIARASESAEKHEQFRSQMENAQHSALGGFQEKLDELRQHHGGELQRQSDLLLEQLQARIRDRFDESNRAALAEFQEKIESIAQPHLAKPRATLEQLTGSQSPFDTQLSANQERIRNAADEAFAGSLAHFRENLGSVEQLVNESERSITARNLADLEAKADDLKHRTVEDLFKTSQWYEKKAQTVIQGFTDKATEQTGNQLREKAGEISGVFASELDNTSRNYVAHTQSQFEEMVRESFAKSQALFAEAAETTAAAFTDEIQRHARRELTGVDEEIQQRVDTARQHLAALSAEHSQKISAEQEDFLRRFQASIIGALEAGVAEAHRKVQAGLGPLLDSWKTMTDAHRAEMEAAYRKMSQESAEQYHTRLENISKQWMLTTVTALDHQSREVLAGISAATEEKLRETCSQVFAGIGDALRERLQEIAASFNPPTPESPKGKAQGA